MIEAITKAILAILAAFLIAAPAQANSTATVKVTLDQAFRVGDTLMPSGDYKIRLLSVGSDSPVLVFQTEGNLSVMAPVSRVQTDNGRLDETTELIFNSSEQGLSIKEIRIAGQPFRYQIIAAR